MKLKNKGWACIALAVCLAASSLMYPSFADVQIGTGYGGERYLGAFNKLLTELEPDMDGEMQVPSNEEDGSDDAADKDGASGEDGTLGEGGIENEGSEDNNGQSLTDESNENGDRQNDDEDMAANEGEDDEEALLQILSDMLEEDPLSGSTDPDDIALVLFGEGNIPEGMEVINDPDSPWEIEYFERGDITKTVKPVNIERDSRSTLTIRFTKAASLSFYGKPTAYSILGQATYNTGPSPAAPAGSLPNRTSDWVEVKDVTIPAGGQINFVYVNSYSYNSAEFNLGSFSAVETDMTYKVTAPDNVVLTPPQPDEGYGAYSTITAEYIGDKETDGHFLGWTIDGESEFVNGRETGVHLTKDVRVEPYLAERDPLYEWLFGDDIPDGIEIKNPNLDHEAYGDYRWIPVIEDGRQAAKTTTAWLADVTSVWSMSVPENSYVLFDWKLDTFWANSDMLTYYIGEGTIELDSRTRYKRDGLTAATDWEGRVVTFKEGNWLNFLRHNNGVRSVWSEEDTAWISNIKIGSLDDLDIPDNLGEILFGKGQVPAGITFQNADQFTLEGSMPWEYGLYLDDENEIRIALEAAGLDGDEKYSIFSMTVEDDCFISFDWRNGTYGAYNNFMGYSVKPEGEENWNFNDDSWIKTYSTQRIWQAESVYVPAGSTLSFAYVREGAKTDGDMVQLANFKQIKLSSGSEPSFEQAIFKTGVAPLGVTVVNEGFDYPWNVEKALMEDGTAGWAAVSSNMGQNNTESQFYIQVENDSVIRFDAKVSGEKGASPADYLGYWLGDRENMWSIYRLESEFSGVPTPWTQMEIFVPAGERLYFSYIKNYSEAYGYDRAWITNLSVERAEKVPFKLGDANIDAGYVVYGQRSAKIDFYPYVETVSPLGVPVDAADLDAYTFTFESYPDAGLYPESSEFPRDVGQYRIIPHYSGVQSDIYVLEPPVNDSYMWIEQKWITIEIENTEKVYGDPNPLITFTVDESQLEYEDTLDDLNYVDFRTNAHQWSDAGEYYIYVQNDYEFGNYRISANSGRLKVKPKDISGMQTKVDGINGSEGTVESGQVLTASLAELENWPDIYFEWDIDGDIQEGKSLLVTDAMSNKLITVQTKAASDNYTGVTVGVNVQVDKVKLAGSPVIEIAEKNADGEAIGIGDELSVNLDGVTPEESWDQLEYQWYLDGILQEGENGDSYTVSGPGMISVAVSVSQDSDFTGALTSSVVEVGKIPLSGNVWIYVEDGLLPGDVLSLDMIDFIGDAMFYWLRDSVEVSGPHGEDASYTLTKEDMGRNISLKASAQGMYTGEIISDPLEIPADVPEAPALSAKAGNSAVTLSWEAPFDSGDPILGYYIYMSTGETFDDYNNEMVGEAGGASRSYTVSNLENGTAYSFKLSAYNGVGESDLSQAVSVTPSTQEEGSGGNGGGGNGGSGGSGGGGGGSEASSSGIEINVTGNEAEINASQMSKGDNLTVNFDLSGEKVTLYFNKKVYASLDKKSGLKISMKRIDNGDVGTGEAGSAPEGSLLAAYIIDIYSGTTRLDELPGDGVQVTLPMQLADGTAVSSTSVYKLDSNLNWPQSPLQGFSYSEEKGTVSGNIPGAGNYAVVYRESSQTGTSAFADVFQSRWSYEYILYLAERGIVSGVSETEFAPERDVTRAEFVRMLAGVDGVDLSSYDTAGSWKFKDIDQNAWYAPGVAWASDIEAVAGTSEDEFSHGRSITRQEMAAIIHRYIVNSGISLDETRDATTFADDTAIAHYAKEGIYVMYCAGLIDGMGNGMFSPEGAASREQAAKILAMLHQQIGDK